MWPLFTTYKYVCFLFNYLSINYSNIYSSHITMVSSTESLTGDLKRPRTLQGRYGRHIEQSWVGRRVTKMISTLKETVRKQEHVAKERQITLDILEGRRPQAGVTLSTALVVEEEVRDEEHVARERQLTLDILEGRRPQAGVTLSTAIVVEEEVRDEEHVARERQLTLDILEGRRPQAGVTLSTALVVEEQVRDEEYILNQRQLTLDVLEGKRRPPLPQCTLSEFAAWHCRHLAAQAGQ
ncbi:hypothetical protein BDZ89DRAFT_1113319 [Hymenopellis radicata]|nr:hypothetical protein BDZ89DRAFT_1113319 [Hymenopellis radicata]